MANKPTIHRDNTAMNKWLQTTTEKATEKLGQNEHTENPKITSYKSEKQGKEIFVLTFSYRRQLDQSMLAWLTNNAAELPAILAALRVKNGGK